MAASTTAHMRTAIIEALTTDRTGEAGLVGDRAIPSAYLFRRGLPPGLDATVRAARVTDKPGAFVVVARVTPEDGPGTELGSDHIYRAQIVISRDYYLGHEQVADDIDDAFTRVTDDLMRIRWALCCPGALDATAAGSATGIGPEALRPLGDQSVLQVEQVGNGRSRLLNARDTFWCPFLYQPA